jgi:Uncharacterized alpha/beta hydrolase domain (DUF2235)
MTTAKRLALFLDGTWNAADSESPLTNVVRMGDLVEAKWQDPVTQAVESQRIYYDEGVGSDGGIDRWIAGATGRGLARNVRQAYRFLSQFWEPETEIHVFGFSRGAFTARSLVGFIGAAGLLKAENCTPALEERAWQHYRTPPKDRYPSEKLELDRYTHPQVRISCLGVFDTVGALGIPVGFLRGWNRRRFSFHDTKLSSIVDHALQALAVDEKRGPFAAAVWAYPDHRNYQSVEQVWFPGAHSDVGGGYEERGLADLSLRWMLDRLDAKGLGLKLNPASRTIVGDPIAQMHESRTAPYAMSRIVPMIRIINQARLSSSVGLRFAGIPRHANPIGEMLHWSVLERWRRSELGDCPPYRPLNAEAAIRTIYEDGHAFRTQVAGPHGEPLRWDVSAEDRELLASLMPDAFRRDFKAACLRHPL